jgi:hypothetical protein
MANIDSPFGLKPVRHKSGAPYNGACNPYIVLSTYGTALFIGDPVVKVAGGSNTAAVEAPGAGKFAIGTLPSVERTVVGDVDGITKMITGVIVGFAPLASDLTKKHNPASTERVVFVCDDPDMIFEMQADGAVAAASMGLNAVLIATHSGSTVSGLSGMELDTTSDVPAADASNQLLIVRAVNREDNDTTIAHAKVEVLINCHTQAPGSTAAGDGTLGI